MPDSVQRPNRSSDYQEVSGVLLFLKIIRHAAQKGCSSCLHTGRGNEIWLVAQWSAQDREGEAGFPFIVVSPQCPTGETWSSDVRRCSMKSPRRIKSMLSIFSRG